MEERPATLTGTPDPLPPSDQPKLSDFKEQQNPNPKANENLDEEGAQGKGDSEVTDGEDG